MGGSLSKIKIKENDFDVRGTKWDQSTYIGRVLHFFKQTDPRNILASNEELENARFLISELKQEKKLPQYSNNALWDAKYLYDSAFHPDTGEKQFVLGRMSAQVPCNVFLTVGLLATYRSTPGLLFFQWINQSFNAGVNYTNRSGGKELSVNSLLASYVCATAGAVGTAITLNRLTAKSSSLVQRLVPFVAITAANFINISIMRNNELVEGVSVYDKTNKYVGNSVSAAKIAIGSVILSRCSMNIPTLILTPILLNSMVRKGILKQTSPTSLAFQALVCAICFIFAVPICCAFFPQQMKIKVERLEPDIISVVKKNIDDDSPVVYFNKGL